jgi:hypothetical protein
VADADWNAIKKEYISSNITHKELAEKHSISLSAVEKRSSQEKWGDLKKKICKKTEERVINSVSKRNAKLDRAIDLAIDAALGILKSGMGGTMRATDLRDCVTALKTLREMKGIKNQADMDEQRARIDALKARAEASKAFKDEDDQGGVILLSEVDEAPEGSDGT